MERQTISPRTNSDFPCDAATNSRHQRGSMQMNRPPSILEYHAMQRNRGFTLRDITIGSRLIDVLLVVLSIVIAMGIAVPTYSSGASPKLNAAKATISMCKRALDNFQERCGRYPTSAEGFSILINQPPGVAGWMPFVDKIPMDPWGNPIRYTLNANGTYQLYSLGPDQQDGTADDISLEDL
jgi:general secretion pathway protein G